MFWAITGLRQMILACVIGYEIGDHGVTEYTLQEHLDRDRRQDSE